eukprot:GHVP01050684.1.p2 GENE.GHVP01050684.1~~GHVP01050684.1.p2  ORF type:complete len:266 (-),score=38.66 GHVP01050684.1:2047-2844(-)
MVRFEQVMKAKSLVYGGYIFPKADTTGIIQYPVQRMEDYFYERGNPIAIRNSCISPALLMAILSNSNVIMGENVWVVDGVNKGLGSVNEMMSLSIGSSPNGDVVYLKREKEEGTLSKISVTNERIIIGSKFIDLSIKELLLLVSILGFYPDNIAESLAISEYKKFNRKVPISPGEVNRLELNQYAVERFKDIRFSNDSSPKELILSCDLSIFSLDYFPSNLSLPGLVSLTLKEYAVNFLPCFDFSSNLKLDSISLLGTEKGAYTK